MENASIGRLLQGGFKRGWRSRSQTITRVIWHWGGGGEREINGETRGAKKKERDRRHVTHTLAFLSTSGLSFSFSLFLTRLMTTLTPRPGATSSPGKLDALENTSTTALRHSLTRLLRLIEDDVIACLHTYSRQRNFFFFLSFFPFLDRRESCELDLYKWKRTECMNDQSFSRGASIFFFLNSCNEFEFTEK